MALDEDMDNFVEFAVKLSIFNETIIVLNVNMTIMNWF
ncbi:hypothetical protein UF75_5275 [Desulfosporosinus sp. I2]|nr:hypothetical protein UF75_5275 [Desulfosporosinus sp. I2]